MVKKKTRRHFLTKTFLITPTGIRLIYKTFPNRLKSNQTDIKPEKGQPTLPFQKVCLDKAVRTYGRSNAIGNKCTVKKVSRIITI